MGDSVPYGVGRRIDFNAPTKDMGKYMDELTQHMDASSASSLRQSLIARGLGK